MGETLVKKTLLAILALAAVPGAVQAQDAYVPFEGFYIAAGGGLVFPIAQQTGFSTYTGWLAGGKIGYDFLGPRVDLEVGYGRTGNNVFFPGSAVSGSSGQMNVMANAYYDFMVQERFNPYIGAGVGIAFVDSNQALGSTQFAWQAMIGAQYHIDSSWAIGLEGRYMGTTNPSINTPTGTVYSQNQTVAILAGIGFKFGAPSAAPPPPPPAVAPPSFMVFFDWDRSNLSAQALNTIKQAASAYKTKGNARITATGPPDTSAPEAYTWRCRCVARTRSRTRWCVKACRPPRLP